ncbi:GlxA family transcriptional regulator [Mesorhizobium sp. RP14(2022)]|uniref:GlxA family transcriptional regulator n=1 Tax=Mesorhizobium liriopis TaxID=2953882 RepID=A0ABT1CCY3_9HYPH|nr:GlxA family transcriptional regulator [Mesorhizobium liriopis]MCO6051801.1 GlxA family transcriptional regulator [Mesorhizobium liriopis]
MSDQDAMRVGFILTPSYALMSLASAVEPLRAANLLAGCELYRVSFLSVAGGFMASTAGGGFMTAPLAAAMQSEADIPDLVFVVAGGNPMLFADAELDRSLRQLQRKRVALGGISGGPAILAKAGLMEGRRFTVHWEHLDALREYAPDLLLEHALYVIDRDRYSCAGGVAAIDMMGALIARQHGASFARDVSDWFIHPGLRKADQPQLEQAGQRLGFPHPVLEAAVELMSTHIADPLSPEQIASLSGVGLRQLQRLFAERLGARMMVFYRDLRLAKADQLLQQTALPVLEIALMSGFASAAHFSRAFAEKYGAAPRERRRAALKMPSATQ